MPNRVTLITAAGGNGTAIQIIDQPLTRAAYEAQGRVLGQSLEADGAEQAGFLVFDTQHFEMAGGEFCGNASRAAAILFSEASGQDRLAFSVSGFAGRVSAAVQRQASKLYRVRGEFPNLPAKVSAVALPNGQPASIVDLGGIVHVVIDAPFPKNPTGYKLAHGQIVARFGLENHAAVGVTWYRRNQGVVAINPVVWVKAVDTFCHETSCGSGTIAAGLVTGATSVVQPTGKSIEVEVSPGFIALTSEMEVVR